MMPAPGGSVEALAAMICTSAQGVAGAGIAPTDSVEAARINAVNAFENVLACCCLRCVSYILFESSYSTESMCKMQF
jgi:hypothetical protein